jgi:cysteinyl-tRNA synthetase
MSIRLYNTLTRQKDELETLPGFDPHNVRMYVCGPTVYDYAHIGNARPVIVFDVLYRLLQHFYGADHVTYVRNVTDVDDKINARAAETAAAKDISVEQARVEITVATAKQFDDDVAALGNLKPTKEPRATEYIRQMVTMIERLVTAGHAYAAEGHVLFDVSSKADYGKLARRSLDEMMAGARVEVAPYKKNPMDFVLWKPSDANTPGWDSPWGRGRPGWHIECSAMGEALLGETFDIHGGGVDLTFPHHENEIAQSESVHHGHPLARIWMHNGFLQVEGEKMSKSLGNFITINELLATRKFGGRAWPGEVLRLAMLKTHYRQPIDFTLSALEESAATLEKWARAIRDITPEPGLPSEAAHQLADDLSTPSLITWLHSVYNVAALGGESGQHATQTLARTLAYFGFGGLFSWHAEALEPSEAAEVEALIAARTAARKAKDFQESDRIRDELLAKGIVLKDGPTGTAWEVKR